MKNLDEYTDKDLIELSENIDELISSPVPRGKKDKMQYWANIHDRMRLYHTISGNKVYNLNYGK